MSDSLLSDLGLEHRGRWWRDPCFLLAAAAAAPLALALGLALGAPMESSARSLPLVLGLTVLQPAIEELLFRGVIQGQLRGTTLGRWQTAGITGANLLTSLLFVAAHLPHHPPVWALAVMVPSLVFGLMRDRHGSIYPGFALHCGYNGLYLLAGLP